MRPPKSRRPSAGLARFGGRTPPRAGARAGERPSVRVGFSCAAGFDAGARSSTWWKPLSARSALRRPGRRRRRADPSRGRRSTASRPPGRGSRRRRRRTTRRRLRPRFPGGRREPAPATKPTTTGKSRHSSGTWMFSYRPLGVDAAAAAVAGSPSRCVRLPPKHEACRRRTPACSPSGVGACAWGYGAAAPPGNCIPHDDPCKMPEGRDARSSTRSRCCATLSASAERPRRTRQAPRGRTARSPGGSRKRMPAQTPLDLSFLTSAVVH